MEYNKLVDEELTTIESALDEVADDVDNLDYSIASGVLSINMGSKGSYVINKQSPNMQIWWSSPISGPKRFEYDLNSKKWYEVGEMDGVKNSRKVNEDINSLLAKELKNLLGVDLKF
ncbi:Frataxin [Blastocystis hominis]|uniref:Frataxin n=1 Tax=Blastocystis hominis TaxID=12968 RepID=D8M5N5_BLAHO|nr:Frataxin [Blastocystis hominis]CBK23374.2 Frataxin [Blastocystis hominis]|eukprot:XP_012897422.1 Frataxin [Blastocystis hominis]